MEPTVNNTLDHLFRHEYGRIVAGLTSKFGSENIDQIEDAVQDSLLKAMKIWGFNKIPDNPTAWLFQVAKNKIIDTLRRENKSESISIEYSQTVETNDYNSIFEIEDEQLKMIFACCNPALTERESIFLSLKLIGGFGISEIARLFLMKEEATKKSIQRAKVKFREEVKLLRIPHGDEMKGYLRRVIKVIYLIFTEGYKSTKEKELIRQDLCGEALRLALILTKNKYSSAPVLSSLIALMCFKVSRFDARIEKGRLITLENQDRAKWLLEYVQWGFYYYSQATKNRDISKYYLEASIEFQYHITKSFEEINWSKILDIYDLLLNRKKSPFLEINRLIVYSYIKGSADTLKKLKDLEPTFINHHLFHAFSGDLFFKLKKYAQSKESYRKAIQLTTNELEKEHLIRKLESTKLSF